MDILERRCQTFGVLLLGLSVGLLRFGLTMLSRSPTESIRVIEGSEVFLNS